MLLLGQLFRIAPFLYIRPKPGLRLFRCCRLALSPNVSCRLVCELITWQAIQSRVSAACILGLSMMSDLRCLRVAMVRHQERTCFAQGTW